MPPSAEQSVGISCIGQQQSKKLSWCMQRVAVMAGLFSSKGAKEDFYYYHAARISRPSLFSVSSAVGLFCIIPSALNTDSDIKCYSLHPSCALVSTECDFAESRLKAGQCAVFQQSQREVSRVPAK